MTACSAACLGQGPTTTLPFLSPLASPRAGEGIGKAMQAVLNSPPEAVQKYSVEDDSMLGRMFGTRSDYHSSIFIALGVAFLIFVVFAVVKTRRASKVRAPTWSRSAGADGVIIDDVDTEVPHSAVLVVARELDGEAFE